MKEMDNILALTLNTTTDACEVLIETGTLTMVA
jgi:hypothetical protein